MLWQMLATFVFRLSLGTAIAMAMTPSKLVTSGFFRVHLWMLMGLNTFAALAVGTSDFAPRHVLWITIAAVVVSYVGAVIWMYERRIAGVTAICIVAILGLIAAVSIAPKVGEGVQASLLGISLAGNGGLIDIISSSTLLGLVMTSMLLGHWYLNTPTMKLAPLKRLVLAMLVAVVVRAVICGVGCGAELTMHTMPRNFGWYGLLSLRWLSGLIGITVLGWMTWETLKIPNTQSATGILYVAVMFSFLGELSSQLLAAGAVYPL